MRYTAIYGSSRLRLRACALAERGACGESGRIIRTSRPRDPDPLQENHPVPESGKNSGSEYANHMQSDRRLLPGDA